MNGIYQKRIDLVRRGWLVVLVVIWVQGCGKPPAPPPPPAPAVTVAYPVYREVIEWDTYTGFLEAPESVNVAARVSGLIVATPFTEGAIVKKGDVLFSIDDRPYKADLAAKIADQDRSQALLAISQANFDRQVEAIKAHAVSQQDFDTAKATRDEAAAVLDNAKAAVALSRLNLEWCQVTSPIDGRVANKIVTVGNLVNGGAGQATLLTTIQSVDPVYCYVDVDEHSVLKYQTLAAEKKRVSARDSRIPCFLQLGNETGFPHVGVVDFVDNHVNATTGTLRARGVYPNPDKSLLPGLFASIRVAGSGRYHTLLVPDTAIGVDQNERNVLVVNKDDTVEAHIVELGATFGPLRSIVSGLDRDDRVIINGQMHARPGSKVAPTEGKIVIDLTAFATPGSPATQALPTTAPVPAANAAETQPTVTQPTAVQPSATQPTGNTP
jgi:RND family efflux transporter MFP subunit